MRVHPLVRRPPARLAVALEEFEKRFSYPLGEGSRFRISHGEDYSRFFRAMGNAVVFVAERDGKVLGTLGAAERELVRPDGESSRALYVCDLKVVPGAAAGMALLRLCAALKAWVPVQVTTAFAVVMDGTTMTPERYTGRLGIPSFHEVAKIAVLRLPCDGVRAGPANCSRSESKALATYKKLVRGCYATAGGNPAERSAVTPVWLSLATGDACAMVEDTRKAKRLFAIGGAELQSAHLSYFAFDNARAGAELLFAAAEVARTMRFPALFCALPANQAPELLQALGSPAPEVAPATVYGIGFPEPLGWHINTSEI